MAGRRRLAQVCAGQGDQDEQGRRREREAAPYLSTALSTALRRSPHGSSPRHGVQLLALDGQDRRRERDVGLRRSQRLAWLSTPLAAHNTSKRLIELSNALCL